MSLNGRWWLQRNQLWNSRLWPLQPEQGYKYCSRYGILGKDDYQSHRVANQQDEDSGKRQEVSDIHCYKCMNAVIIP